MALAMSVEAIRKPVINFIIRHFSNHSTIAFSEDRPDMSEQDNLSSVIDNAPVPDGYGLVKKTINEGRMINLLYKNLSDDQIRLIITYADGVFDFDSEGFEKQNILINGYYQGILLVKDQEKQIVWIDENNMAMFYLRAYNLDDTNFWEIVNYWSAQKITMGEDII